MSALLEEAPAALAILSGALIARPEWSRLAPKRAGLRVLQSHGTADPILPFLGATALRPLLEAAGLAVDFVSFPGGHGVPPDAVHKLATLIGSSGSNGSNGSIGSNGAMGEAR